MAMQTVMPAERHGPSRGVHRPGDRLLDAHACQQVAPMSRDNEQRVVDPDTDHHQRGQRGREARDRHAMGEDRDQPEAASEPGRRAQQRQHGGAERLKDEPQDDHRRDEAEDLWRDSGGLDAHIGEGVAGELDLQLVRPQGLQVVVAFDNRSETVWDSVPGSLKSSLYLEPPSDDDSAWIATIAAIQPATTHHRCLTTNRDRAFIEYFRSACPPNS
jgi:hypothetical protein